MLMRCSEESSFITENDIRTATSLAPVGKGHVRSAIFRTFLSGLVIG